MLSCGICIVLNLIRPKADAKLTEILGTTKLIQDDYSDWTNPALKSAAKLQQGYAVYLRSNGTRSRRAIFHVTPGGSVPTLEDLSAD